MGKITSLYLTDEEAAELKKFCEENRCTQYSALKTALRELLSRPPKGNKEEPSIDSEIEVIEQSAEDLKAEEREKSYLSKLLELLRENS